MALPYITMMLPQGTSILVQLEDSGGQFVISYADPGGTPEGMEVQAVRVMADLPDSSGREGIVYEELFGSLIEEQETAEVMEPSPVEAVSIPAAPPPVFSATPPSLDQLLAGAIARDPETGALPTEPAPEAVETSESKAPTPAATGPAAQGNAVETPSQGYANGLEPLPAGAKPMDASPPRGGERVVLYQRESTGELTTVEAKWSSHIGRQFWVDADDEETLGFDDAFIAWSPISE